jgi:hypothetical protein
LHRFNHIVRQAERIIDVFEDESRHQHGQRFDHCLEAVDDRVECVVQVKNAGHQNYDRRTGKRDVDADQEVLVEIKCC